jgi:UDPglucose 6-dehydrogenase
MLPFARKYGHEVYAYDINPVRIVAYQTGKIEEIERFINEPACLQLLPKRSIATCFLRLMSPHISKVQTLFFLCLPTPPNPDGSSDLSYYFAAVEYLAELLAKRT